MADADTLIRIYRKIYLFDLFIWFIYLFDLFIYLFKDLFEDLFNLFNIIYGCIFMRH